MLDMDFDSTTSTSTSLSVDENGNKISTQEINKSTESNEEPKEKEEIYESPKVPDYNDPDQIYEDTNEESHTFHKLNHELESEQNNVANQAKNSEDLSKLISRDNSYDPDDHPDYGVSRYSLISIDSNPKLNNRLIRSSIFDKYIRDYSELDQLDPGQSTIEESNQDTESNIDQLLSMLD